jgi:hypothetical protein
VEVVFDTSAVLAYARSAIAPGELLMMVGEEDGQVGVPVTCVAEAYAEVKEPEGHLLRYLSTAVPAVAVLGLDLADAPTVGRLGRHVSLGTAHAIALAGRLNAYVATSQGEILRGIGIDGAKIIDM